MDAVKWEIRRASDAPRGPRRRGFVAQADCKNMPPSCERSVGAFRRTPTQIDNFPSKFCQYGGAPAFRA